MSLLGITRLPTAENSTIHPHPSDSVAVARVPIREGVVLRIAGQDVCTRAAIAAGHKVSVRRIEPGETILRYGHVIGRARSPIEPGDHVHTHNVAFEEIEFAYDFPANDFALPDPVASSRTFMDTPSGRPGGHSQLHRRRRRQQLRRAHGRADRGQFDGEPLPGSIDGVVAFPHGEGCGHTIGPDTRQLQRTLAGVLDHPNVSAAIILGLGCEVNQSTTIWEPDVRAPAV